ncbi:MAG: DUF1566 domain-containing protein [Thermodesulfobacteriota bacterium]
MRRLSEIFHTIHFATMLTVAVFALAMLTGVIGCDTGGGGVSRENEIDYTCTDADSDGYYGQAGCGTTIDPNDNDATIYPGAPEVCADGIDNDFDDYIDEGCAPGCTDIDKDGYYAGAGCVTPVDCDDMDAAVHPGGGDICADDVDNDCDGLIDPGCPPEICGDGIDNDGDQFIDEECVAGDSSVPDTGQSVCYGYNERIFPCPVAGEAFYGQDACYRFDGSAYTKLDDSAGELPDDTPVWAMVKDNVTGLIWELKTDNGNLQDKDFTYTWNDAQEFILDLNRNNFGGYSDWRLPTVNELAYIVNYGAYGPAIDRSYFPNTINGQYWTAIPYATDDTLAWRIDFYDGGPVVSAKEELCYVRAVRGRTDAPSFRDNGNNTVTDNVTGLMWTKFPTDTMSWQEGLAYCENLTLAGYSDWRLPNIKELRSIVDYTVELPSIDLDFFPETIGSAYWSSTTYHVERTRVWVIGFYSGVGGGTPKGMGSNVRAVRDL